MDMSRHPAPPGTSRHDRLFALIRQQAASRPRRTQPPRPDAVNDVEAAEFLAAAGRSFDLAPAEQTLVDRLRAVL